MFTKKITKEALYLPASIMHHLSCLARMGEDSCIFFKNQIFTWEEEFGQQIRETHQRPEIHTSPPSIFIFD